MLKNHPKEGCRYYRIFLEDTKTDRENHETGIRRDSRGCSGVKDQWRHLCLLIGQRFYVLAVARVSEPKQNIKYSL
ncbi:MAG: hypothetical protein WA667_20570 [Candidatus Nitrosopolaris sp.]